ncbi:MAG: leucyl aminopeptidase [Alphaproteobacteria bacterium]|nr:leucyl aminopeptidase [Alphaproteobacteria bacterium]
MKVTFAPSQLPTQGTVILTVALDQKFGDLGQKLDKKTGGALKRAMAVAQFTGKRDEIAQILAPAKTRLERIILVGIGKPADLKPLCAQKSGGAGIGAALSAKATHVEFVADSHKGNALSDAEFATNLAFGARLRGYRFDKYHTKKPEGDKTLKGCAVATADSAGARKAFATHEALAEGVELARNLVTEPGNVIYPITLAEHCVALRALGVKVEVLDEKAMAKLGMGALLGVAQGSANPPRLVTMHWVGDKEAKDKSPVALVGKGVTFDSGGISLKPGPGMEEMIFDMAGSAAVIGTIHALAKSKAPLNVVGLVGLVENMPGGKAQRPGDIVTTMSGQTVEVHNTDAEGRLVLADVVWYAQETFKPKKIVDLATLTGAIIIALGHDYAGLFSNDEAFSAELQAASKATEEKIWPFPMDEAYGKMLDADTADIKNITGGREAGSITGAKFIERFIKKGTAWAHLDIAGTAWLKKPTAFGPKGATGFGVRLLHQYLTSKS